MATGSVSLTKLLSDFLFRDGRLGSHPKVSSAEVHFAWDGVHLKLVARVSRRPPTFGESGRSGSGLLDRAFATLEPQVGESDILWTPQPAESDDFRSEIAVPIGHGQSAIGVIALDSQEPDFFREEDIGRLRLLGALLAVAHDRSGKRGNRTEATTTLGQALRAVRHELGLTQDVVAARGGLSRMALSQWEAGRWPPSLGPIYRWCHALELVTEESTPRLSFVDVTPQLLRLLRENPEELRSVSPEQFERIVAERIDRMGYDVQLTGRTAQRDGGIDLIAVPKIRTVGSTLMAVQIKHHQGEQKTGRPAVDRLLAWKDSPFRVGLLVTNTKFSKDARWLAAQANNQAFLRLRDFEDLKRWLQDQFDAEDWREIPDVITLAPGITIAVPKAKLAYAKEFWPLTRR